MIRSTNTPRLLPELSLLFLLALLWGGSYPVAKIALAELPPLTLAATRVTVAALLLYGLMRLRSQTLPRDAMSWRRLLIQAVFNSIAAWSLLAWGQQYVDSGLASVLNSTSPIFVFFLTLLITRHESTGLRRFLGALLGLAGVVMIIGTEALDGLGREVVAQLAVLCGAILYAGAAIYGKRLSHMSVLVSATGTMICAAVVLLPVALLTEQPWQLRPGLTSLTAAAVLSVFCTAIALQIYFRLIRTLGSLGAASQAYLRAGVGVLLGMVFLGERLEPATAAGLACAIAGVFLINWPAGAISALRQSWPFPHSKAAEHATSGKNR